MKHKIMMDASIHAAKRSGETAEDQLECMGLHMSWRTACG